ncbi:MAG: class II fructose-bisphosphate aldolase [Bacteroidales bacterium]|nr:class II fructose-bisphosphate aldolase [Bacteroidales bacterium]
MPLVSMKRLMNHALANKYAVGYFEAWNMDSILAVVDAAEMTNSPVIIGFGGQFIGSMKRTIKENIYHYGSLGKSIAENAKVPVALLLNEAHDIAMLINGLKAGFNAIMYEDHGISLNELIDINKYLVRTAHYCGADVEAEIGELPNADISTGSISQGRKTDPDEAAYFVEETCIDALAVSVGNVHLLENKKSDLDFELIKILRKKIKVPLVLHGGTGILPENLKEAIKLGMCKINVGTILKRGYLKSIQSYLNDHEVDMMDPHDIIGRGGELDMLSGARESVADEVVKFIKIFGCENMAHLI